MKKSIIFVISILCVFWFIVYLSVNYLKNLDNENKIENNALKALKN